MRFLVVLALVGVAIAAPSRSYNGGSSQGSSLHGGSDIHGGSIQGGSIHGGSIHGGSIHGGSIHGGSIQGGNIHGGNIHGSSGGYGGGYGGGSEVTRNVYVYESPQQQVLYGPAPIVPKGKVHHNIIFIKTPEIVGTNEPILIPATQTKTVLYVLSKNGQQGQRVVQIADAPQQAPEVYYVHYNDGENPVLPDGRDLHSALADASSGFGKSVSGGLGGGYGGGHATLISSNAYGDDDLHDDDDIKIVAGLGGGFSRGQSSQYQH